MNAVFAAWSDNFVYAAAAVMALAFLAHGAEWAFARERTSRAKATAKTAGTAGAVTGTAAGAGDGENSPVAVLERPVVEPSGSGEPERAERSDMFGRIGVGLTILAAGLLGLGVLARGLAADRVPWSDLYEFATTGTFVVAVVYLTASKRFGLGWLGLPLTGLLLTVLSVAIRWLYTPVSDLIPALESYWLIIHVSAAATATGVFTVGMVASVLQILRARAERGAIASGQPVRGNLARLPSSEAIDRVAYRLHAFAFPIWTFALITGAIWAAAAWGRYWGWDPKETWMFITWVIYAAYLHARSTAGWRSKVSWIALAGYGALLFNLIGVNFVLDGLHSYAGI